MVLNMSDPVSNAEIEDVLSSIRRLVSVDDRDDTQSGEGRETSETGATETAQGGRDDRLMLTPALRVDDCDTVPQTDAEPQTGAAPEANALWFSHSDPDHAVQDTADASADHHSPDQTETRDSDSGERADDAPYLLDQTQVADPLDAPGLGDRIAEVEAAVAAQNDQWEPDGESDDAYYGGTVSPMACEDYGPKPTYDDAYDDDLTGDADDTDIPGARAFGDRDEHRIDADDQTADAPMGDDAGATSDDEDDAALWGDDRADAIIDEEALRDMVSEIVRQELQGALGERITRNVRKLVRREIHRALSSHDLD